MSLRHGQVSVNVAPPVIDEVRIFPGGVIPIHTEASTADHDLVNGSGVYWYVGGRNESCDHEQSPSRDWGLAKVCSGRGQGLGKQYGLSIRAFGRSRLILVYQGRLGRRGRARVGAILPTDPFHARPSGLEHGGHMTIHTDRREAFQAQLEADRHGVLWLHDVTGTRYQLAVVLRGGWRIVATTPAERAVLAEHGSRVGDCNEETRSMVGEAGACSCWSAASVG